MSKYWQTKHGAGRYKPLILVLIILVGLTGLLLPHSSLAADDTDTDGLAVVIRPEPSIRVMPGTTLAYNLLVKNYGQKTANSILIHMPYNPEQLTLIGTDFEQPGDWVSAIARDHIQVRFASMQKKQQRAATLYMHVADNLSAGTVINMWAGYSWDETASAHSSNAAPVLIGPQNDSSPWVWMTVDPPQNQAGGTFTFFSDRFLPDEQVFSWINTPDGPVGTGLSASVDGQGRVTFRYASNNLPPGTYQMVARGEYSGLTSVVTFEVVPSPG